MFIYLLHVVLLNVPIHIFYYFLLVKCISIHISIQITYSSSIIEKNIFLTAIPPLMTLPGLINLVFNNKNNHFKF